MHQCFIVEPVSQHTHTIIFLHGRGSSGPEFAKELFECQVKNISNPERSGTLSEALPSLKWIFPSAPSRYSATFKEDMPQWFEVHSLSNPDDQQETQLEGLTSSVQMIQELVNAELMIVQPGRLFLGGISQGAAAGMIAMIALNLELGGFVGLSSWLPCSNSLSKDLSHEDSTATDRIRSLLVLGGDWIQDQEARWSSTPIFLGHEKHDSIVSVNHGRQAHELLRTLGAVPEWHEYESSDHWIQEPDEAQDIVSFLQRQMTRLQ